MSTYQNANPIVGSTQEAMKVRYTAKTRTTHGETCAYSNASWGNVETGSTWCKTENQEYTR